jgi:glutathione S-transferase
LKIFYSPASPFVRKCLVAAHELGLRDRIELLPSTANPVAPDRTLVASNPLGKVPALLLDDGTVLFDSRVICEYLNAQAGGDLIPREGPARWTALSEQSLADGMSDAAVLARYETAMRPEALRWTDWTTGQVAKINAGLDEFEARASRFGNRVDLGTIAFACALGYVDLRFAALNWRAARPQAAAWYERFGGRESMVTTRPPAA